MPVVWVITFVKCEFYLISTVVLICSSCSVSPAVPAMFFKAVLFLDWDPGQDHTLHLVSVFSLL